MIIVTIELISIFPHPHCNLDWGVFDPKYCYICCLMMNADEDSAHVKKMYTRRCDSYVLHELVVKFCAFLPPFLKNKNEIKKK